MFKVINMTYTGFRLLDFNINDPNLFGEVSYRFIDDEVDPNLIYTTVLIGPNGTLKSRLFQKLIEIFLVIDDLQHKRINNFALNFTLKYSLDNSIYEISWGKVDSSKNSEIGIEGFCFKKNGRKLKSVDEVVLPNSIIATAIMLTDRFPFPDNEKYPFYNYLGSRYRPQLASTKTFVSRVVEFVSKNINSEIFIDGIWKISQEFITNGTSLCISYYTQNTPRFFRGEMTKESFYSYYEDIDEKYKEKSTNPPFKLNHYKKLKKESPETLSAVLTYCNQLSEGKLLREIRGSSRKTITFSLIDEADVKRLQQEYTLLDHMRMLGMIYPAEIEFLKVEEDDSKPKYSGYSIYDSSSGEHNLLGTMIGLISSITPNSLIFIDEPEISLHPNWQMKFLSFLRSLLSDELYSSCHIIVATHSHFLVSDLQGASSSVISLFRDDENRLNATLLDNINPFGWAAEEVLLKVFNVATSRNYFVAEKLGTLLDLIAKESVSDDEVRSKYFELELDKVTGLTEEDPLKTVFDKIRSEYVS